ncbi:hypothetical protein Bbelb_313370 [Branchiostoma belcheri]|nr:hypothetical protein Bbelb_313370 [Branchiostoma belcheri]
MSPSYELLFFTYLRPDSLAKAMARSCRVSCVVCPSLRRLEAKCSEKHRPAIAHVPEVTSSGFPSSLANDHSGSPEGYEMEMGTTAAYARARARETFFFY